MTFGGTKCAQIQAMADRQVYFDAPAANYSYLMTVYNNEQVFPLLPSIKGSEEPTPGTFNKCW